MQLVQYEKLSRLMKVRKFYLHGIPIGYKRKGQWICGCKWNYPSVDYKIIRQINHSQPCHVFWFTLHFVINSAPWNIVVVSANNAGHTISYNHNINAHIMMVVSEETTTINNKMNWSSVCVYSVAPVFQRDVLSKHWIHEKTICKLARQLGFVLLKLNPIRSITFSTEHESILCSACSQFILTIISWLDKLETNFRVVNWCHQYLKFSFSFYAFKIERIKEKPQSGKK